jgi:tetratricopeptide (TPR) repeat protein
MRYRLPLYPLLIPYAALAFNARPKFPPKGWAILLPPLTLLLTFAHAPYPLLAWQLGWKHYYLAEGEAALKRGELFLAEKAAKQALLKDSESALAYVLLAQTFIQKGEREAAEKMLREALKVKPAHPYAHLLLGDLLRQRGDFQAAQKELSAETYSLEDLQTWSWEEFSSPWPQKVLLGSGLDLGFIKGFHLSTERMPYRWTKGAALIRLKVAGAQTKLLQLQLASGRPVSAPKPLLEVEIEGKKVGSFPVAAEWRTYHLLLPKEVASKTVLSLQSNTFTPRTYDPTSSDGRRLGIKVGKVEILATLADKK